MSLTWSPTILILECSHSYGLAQSWTQSLQRYTNAAYDLHLGGLPRQRFYQQRCCKVYYPLRISLESIHSTRPDEGALRPMESSSAYLPPGETLHKLWVVSC